MRNGEWSLSYPGTALVFGTAATPVFNLTTPDLGDVEVRTSDRDRPRMDGRAMGVDYRGARTVTFDLGVRAPDEPGVRGEAAVLARAWRADAVRSAPGAVAELRAQYAGRERLMYGRPRRFAANPAEAGTSALITATATFDCVDDVFYDGVEEVQTVDFAPPASGGLVGPLVGPLTTTRTSDRSVGLAVASELPVWPIIEVDGPISNPVVEVVGVFRMELRTTLAYDETLVVDTRPWARTVLRNGTAGLAGAVRGARLSDAAIPPGSYELALRGSDLTGTATARIRWRAAYSTL